MVGTRREIGKRRLPHHDNRAGRQPGDLGHVPDESFRWRTQSPRASVMPDYPDTAYFTLAPDWMCEGLSPSTRKLDLREKRPLYALAGVGAAPRRDTLAGLARKCTARDSPLMATGHRICRAKVQSLWWLHYTQPPSTMKL